MQGRAGSTIVGALIGMIVAAIVAVNLVILSGIDSGYETTIPELFRENVFLGIVTVAILVAGPIVGALYGKRFWQRRHPNAFA